MVLLSSHLFHTRLTPLIASTLLPTSGGLEPRPACPDGSRTSQQLPEGD